MILDSLISRRFRAHTCLNYFRLGALLVGIYISHNSGAQVFYRNPVIAGDHPDPSIIRVGKDYWATCTSSAWGPLFPLLHSTDLVNWEQTGAVVTHRPEWATGDFWAPEISEFNGRFFVYFVARQHNGRLSVAVATAEKPGGPYTDHGDRKSTRLNSSHLGISYA